MELKQKHKSGSREPNKKKNWKKGELSGQKPDFFQSIGQEEEIQIELEQESPPEATDGGSSSVAVTLLWCTVTSGFSAIHGVLSPGFVSPSYSIWRAVKKMFFSLLWCDYLTHS